VPTHSASGVVVRARRPGRGRAAGRARRCDGPPQSHSTRSRPWLRPTTPSPNRHATGGYSCGSSTRCTKSQRRFTSQNHQGQADRVRCCRSKIRQDVFCFCFCFSPTLGALTFAPVLKRVGVGGQVHELAQRHHLAGPTHRQSPRWMTQLLGAAYKKCALLPAKDTT
jgi:hypothetical protein